MDWIEYETLNPGKGKGKGGGNFLGRVSAGEEAGVEAPGARVLQAAWQRLGVQ